jgi:hypothetical protein
MSRRDKDAWNPRDRDYRRGYRQGRAQRRAEARAAQRAARNNSGCLLGFLLIPLALLSYGRGSGGIGPRSTRHLLGPGHGGGGRSGGGRSRHNSGCAVFLVALAPALIAVAGLAAGAVYGWWTT